MKRKTQADPFGQDPGFIALIRPIFQFLYNVYFRVEAKGVANVPAKGPAIIVANHSGGLPYDGPMIHLAIFNNHKSPRMLRYLVEDFVFNVPLLGGYIQKAGGVRACHENATTLLENDELVAVFPEGVKGVGKTFNERYRLKRFGRGGFVRLAMRTGVPIVPVAVLGAEEIHPIIWKSRELAKPFKVPFIPFTVTFPWLGPLGLIPLPAKIRIVFGKPIAFGKFKPRDAENEKLVDREALKVRNKIQRMLDVELAKRKSIWI